MPYSIITKHGVEDVVWRKQREGVYVATLHISNMYICQAFKFSKTWSVVVLQKTPGAKILVNGFARRCDALQYAVDSITDVGGFK